MGKATAFLRSTSLLLGLAALTAACARTTNQPPAKQPAEACTEIGCNDLVTVTVPERLPQALTLTVNGQAMDFCNPGPGENAEWNFQGLVGQYTFTNSWRKNVTVQILNDSTLVTFSPVTENGGQPMENLSLTIATRPNCLVAVMPTTRYTVSQPLTYTTVRPNGPRCEPICHSVKVTLPPKDGSG